MFTAKIILIANNLGSIPAFSAKSKPIGVNNTAQALLDIKLVNSDTKIKNVDNKIMGDASFSKLKNISEIKVNLIS